MDRSARETHDDRMRKVKLQYDQLGYHPEFQFPNLLKVDVPALPYEAYNTDGNIQPWSLQKLMVSGLSDDYWYCGEKMYRYVVQFDMTVDDSFYIMDSPKFPLVLEYTTLYVNNTSQSVQTTLYHKDMKTPYAVNKFVGINFDPVTRQPKPYPKWWREKYEFPTSDAKVKPTKPQPPEDDRYMTNRRSVHFSDIDGSKHMNYMAYTRFCYETLFENSLADKHCYGSDEVLTGKTKTVHAQFKSECLFGDELAIKSWMDTVSSDTYHFEVWNKDALAAIVTLSFYGRDANYSKPSQL